MNLLDRPWLSEPEWAEWEAEGLHCAMRRGGNHSGHWCGYVGIPASHPWFGKSYNDDVKPPRELVDRPIDIEKVGVINVFCASLNSADPYESIHIVLLLDVHGGCTYAGKGHWDSADKSLWYFGFDCAHSGDLSPRYVDDEKFHGIVCPTDVYRDFDYVKAETDSLARQLAAIAKETGAA